MVLMLTLETGRGWAIGPVHKSDEQAGFSLLEVMVSITILAIILGLAAISIPNHDLRYWRHDLNHLTESLNAAQDESMMTGQVILASIDQRGWRFSVDPNSILVGKNEMRTSMTGVFRERHWKNPMVLDSTTYILGEEIIDRASKITIKQDQRKAYLIRKNTGYFAWMNASP